MKDSRVQKRSLQPFLIDCQSKRQIFNCLRQIIIGKSSCGRISGLQRKTNVGHEFGFEVILKNLGSKQRLFQPFLIEFRSNM